MSAFVLPKMTYVNEIYVDCRLRGIVNSIRRFDYERTLNNIVDMIQSLKGAEEIDMPKEVYNKIIDDFYRMRVDASLKKFDNVHNRARDLHFYIMSVTCRY
jgi:hypothetical protein